MTRTTGFNRKRHKNIIKQARGFRNRSKKIYSVAKPAVDKSLVNSYIGRRLKKRNFRSLWIQRINAAVRMEGMKYSDFIYRLTRAKIKINRKILSEMAIYDQDSFKKIVEITKNTSGEV